MVGAKSCRSAKQFLTQSAMSVVALVNPPPLQFGDDEIDEVVEAFRCQGVSKIESVNASFANPTLEIVRDLAGRAYNDWCHSTDAGELSDLTDRPGATWIGYSQCFHGRADGVVFNITDDVIKLVLRKIYARPSRYHRQCT